MARRRGGGAAGELEEEGQASLQERADRQAWQHGSGAWVGCADMNGPRRLAGLGSPGEK